ncbi:MAG: lipopolysaccharide heptosyltransferase II [Desulfurobacteriaceae bacterium]
MRILIFQTAFLGDLILTSPLIKSVKKTFKNATLSIVVREGFESVFEGFEYVSEIIPYNKKGVFWFADLLKEKKFDFVFSPHRSHRTSFILFLAKIKRRIGFSNSGFSFLYTDKVKYRQGEGIHEIDRNLDLLLTLKREYDVVVDKEPELPIDKNESEKALRKFNLEKPYIVLSPGSIWKTKMWLPEYFGEVAKFFEREGVKTVLVGSKKDEEVCKKVFQISRNSLNLCGKTTLREFFSIIKEAQLLISNDSAPIHVASCFNTRTIAIFGPTVPKFGFYPYRNGTVLEVEDLPCRPCGIHGGRRCKEGHFKCMVELKPKKVIEKTIEFLNF